MENHTFEKSTVFTLEDCVQYLPHSIVIKTIIKKLTGNVSLISVECGEAIGEKVLPFDTLIQIIDGKAIIRIDGRLQNLAMGESIIIPAHTCNSMEADGRFKMLSTVIKSGYEDITLTDL